MLVPFRLFKNDRFMFKPWHKDFITYLLSSVACTRKSLWPKLQLGAFYCFRFLDAAAASAAAAAIEERPNAVGYVCWWVRVCGARRVLAGRLRRAPPHRIALYMTLKRCCRGRVENYSVPCALWCSLHFFSFCFLLFFSFLCRNCFVGVSVAGVLVRTRWRQRLVLPASASASGSGSVLCVSLARSESCEILALAFVARCSAPLCSALLFDKRDATRREWTESANFLLCHTRHYATKKIHKKIYKNTKKNTLACSYFSKFF